MLHELLFALYGKCGGIFYDAGDGIKVGKDIPTLHPSEIVILNSLCSLGTKYKFFLTYYEKYDGFRPLLDGKTCGMYLKAFASGLNQVLESYRKDLLSLEQDILSNPHFSLVYIQYQLDKYFLLFPNLEVVIKEVEERERHGCQILNSIHRHLPSGIPVVNDALNRTLQTCHKPLCKQLISWMIHGLLNDPYKEFFIIKCEVKEPTDFQKHTEKDSYTSLHSLCQFDLNPHLLPSYIPIDLAVKILFVGSSVCLFGKRNLQYRDSAGSLFGAEEEEFSKSLYQLQEVSFTTSELRSVVNHIYISCNELVWKVVVEEASLLTHLQRLKNFFLLGRGELFSAFINEASKLLDLPPGESTEFDVNRTFQAVVSSVLGNADTEAENFYLTVKTNADRRLGEHREPSVLDCSNINLTYHVQWPLNSVLTPSILERYNSVFRFLLSLRQVQQDLQQAWMHLMRHARYTVSSQSNTLWQMWTHMMFLINNLQYHIQIEALENEFGQLVKTIETKRDFEEVLLKHNTFLTNVMKATFLSNKQTHYCLMEIMNCCRRFCTWVSAFASGRPQENSLLSTIIVTFQRHTLFLFKNLVLMQPNLYMKIDYNKYLSTSRMEHFGGQVSSKQHL